jgi:hypothetical protein
MNVQKKQIINGFLCSGKLETIKNIFMLYIVIELNMIEPVLVGYYFV